MFKMTTCMCRDLKLDNTLLDDGRPQRIKLCDFGFAKAWDSTNKNMFTHIGYVVIPDLKNMQLNIH